MELVPFIGICLLAGPLMAAAEVGDQYTAVFTPGDGLYNKAWVTVPHEWFQFRVKASKNAKIALTSEPYDIKNGATYEVILGQKENKQTVINTEIGSDQPAITIKDKCLLSDSSYLDIWITWDSSELTVGTGKERGKEECLTLTRSAEVKDLPMIFAVSFATDDVEGFFEFPKYSGPTTYLHTFNQNADHEFAWFSEHDKSNIIFAVEYKEKYIPETSAIKLLLCGEILNTSSNCYKIMLGQKTSSIIKYVEYTNKTTNHVDIASSDHGAILTQEEYRYFWVSWFQGYIEVGEGHEVGYRRLVHGLTLEAAENSTFTAISIGSGGTQDKGAWWQFHIINQNNFLLQTTWNDNRNANNWLNVKGHHSFVFEVRADSDASIILQSMIPPDPEDILCGVVIHMNPGKERGKTTIDVYNCEGALVDGHGLKGDGPDLNKDEFKPVWISWMQGVIKIGAGVKPGYRELMSYDPFEFDANYVPPEIHGMYLNDAARVPGEDIQWLFPTDSGKSTTIYTRASLDGGDTDWIVVIDSYSQVFSVRSTGMLYIDLCQYLGERNGKVYNVFVGLDKGHLVSRISKGDNTVEKPTPDIISADDFRFFWISWRNSIIILGTGAIEGQNPVVSYDDSRNSDKYQVNAIFLTAFGDAEWHFGTQQGPHYAVHTNSLVEDWYEAWFDSPRGLFTFTVQSCEMVEVLLHRSPGAPLPEDGFKIKFSSITGTEIKDMKTGKVENSESFEGNDYNMDCTENKFWISWVESTIRVGKGDPMLNQLVSMDHEHDPLSLRYIKGVSLRSNSSSIQPALWTIPKSIGKTMSVRNTESTPIVISTDNKQSITFRVAAEREATITLQSVQQASANTVKYSVILGDSYNTIIRITDFAIPPPGAIDYCSNNGVLDKDEMRWFWISWSGGAIRVGKGNIVGEHSLCDKPKEEGSNPSIFYVSAHTPQDVVGDWYFSSIEDRQFSVVTPPGQKKAGYPVVMRTARPYFQFNLRACFDAIIELGSQTEPVFMPQYTIHIGAHDNTQLTIWDVDFPDEAVVHASVPDMLDCGEMRPYWVSWEDGNIEIGTGKMPGYAVADYRDSSWQPIVGVALDNWDHHKKATDASWEFSELSVSSLRVETPAPLNLHQFWITVVHQTQIVFRLKSTGNVMITLSKTPEVVTDDTYLLELGWGDNADTYNLYYGYDVRGKRVLKKTRKIPADIMGGGKEFKMWRISWEGRAIHVRQDHILILDYDMKDDANMHITSMAVASDGTHGITNKSIFEFDNLQANDYFFKTEKEMGIKDLKTDIILGSSEVAFKDIEFVVRSEYIVQIGLAVSQNTPSDKLTLTIGFIDQYHITYIEDDSGQILCTSEHRGLLSKTEDVRFWISWNENKVGKSTIKVGMGTLYTTELLSCESDKKPNILSFTSPNGDAFWTITKEQVEAFLVETEKDSAPRLWENVAGEGEAVVHIVTSSDAQIYLSSTAGVIDLATYKVEIQRSFDNLTYITDMEKGDVTNSNERTDLLDGHNFQPFYMDWGSVCDFEETCEQFLKLGKGASMDGDPIVTKTFADNNMHTINALGVTLPKGGIVVMLNSEADTYSLTTHGDMNFRKHWFYMKSPKFSFKVQACSDVLIALNTKSPEDWGDATFYEILLGAHDNTISLIRRRNQEHPVIEVNTPLYLSCYEKRQFWINYNSENGVLEMGTGAMMTHNFLTWTVPGAADIHAVSVATDNTLGLWEIKQNLGPAKFQVVRRPSGGRVATVAEISDIIGDLVHQLDAACNGNIWCIARLVDGRLHGSGYSDSQRIGPIDPTDPYQDDDQHEVILISDAETFHYDHSAEEVNEITWVNVIGRNELRFQVRACEDARLVLADIPGQWNTHAREIRIGIDNIYTAIYDSYNSSKEPLQREDYSNVLNCFEHREFWLSWDFERIDIGIGVADHRILRYTNDDPSNPMFINSIGLYSRPGRIWDGGIDSNWILGDITDTIPPEPLRDDYFTMFTHGPWSNFIRTFNVFGTGFVFTVKAKEQALIYLSEKPGQHEQGTFKIEIGAKGNTKTTIEDLDIPDSIQEFSSPDILSEYQDKEFWVSWSMDQVFVGTGHVFDQSIIASISVFEELLIIHQVALATGSENQSPGRWRIKKDSGRYFNFTSRPFSNDEYKEAWYTSYSQNYCVFQVKAQADAYILLSDRSEETDHVYEIVLGYEGNTKAGIRNITGATGGEGAKFYEEEERADGFLDANALRYFWVRWHQGVEVGDGRVVGQNRFLNFHDPIDRNIKHVSFATGDEGLAEWHLHNSEADTFTIRTPGDDNYDHIWIYPSGHHFEFEVTGCEGANILLAREPYVDNTQHNTVEVIIADKVHCDETLGQCVNIRYPAYGKIKSKPKYYDGPDSLLDCHSARKFWITWYDVGDKTRLIIGRGTLLSEGEWTYDDFYLTFPVRALALSAENVEVPLFPFNLVTWDFSKDLARTTVFDTLASYPYRMHWLNTFLLNSVKFKVKACGDVRLMLSEFFGVGGSYAYEVWFDKKNPDDTISSIILEHADDGDGIGRTVAQSTQVQLDEHYSKWFWISWPGNQLHVGSGPIVENDIIMSWEMPLGVNRHAIEAIAFEAGECDARWEFTEIPDRMFEVVTLFRPPVADEPEGAENYAWVWLHRKYFAFSVQACSKAQISLMHYAGSDNNPDNAGYIIQLDYEDGKSRILDHNNQRVGNMFTGRKILDCNVPAQMWISWLATDNGNRELVVGNGELFTGEIMSFTDETDKFGIHVASLETLDDNIGHWLFRDDSGIKTQFFSGNNFTYDNNVYRVASLDATVFWIQAEMGAYVFLFDHYHTVASYQIELGPEGNQDKIFLRKARDDINSLAVNGTNDGSSILDGKVLLPFWVSWAQARITLGRGEVVGKNPLIDYHDQDKPFSVSYLSFATYAENNKFNTGLWQFYNVSDDTFLVSNYPNQETDDVWFTFSPQQKMYKFSVRACKDAIVQLRSGGQDSTLLFDITLGANDNTRTILRAQDGDKQIIVDDEITPDVLNCYEDRWFILKWEEKLVELYVTSETGRQIIEWYDDREHPQTEQIHGLTLHTEDVFGEWQMPRNPGKALRIKQGRHAAERYCCLWLTVLQRKFIVFSVKASQHASIVLSETPGVTTGRVYEIIIGEDRNQYITIKDGLDGSEENGRKVTSGKGTYLSSTEFRSFFISWANDTIVIGSGTVPAGGGFLTYEPKSPFPVRALSVANEDLLGVVWEFSQISGNQFLTSTTDKKDYSQAVIMPKEKQFIFGVKADANAHIALSTYPNDTKKDTYEVVIGAAANTVVTIRDLNKPLDGSIYEAFPLLDNRKVMYFWLQWITGHNGKDFDDKEYGMILLGRGEIVGEDQIGSAWVSESVMLRNITSISLSTEGNVGAWEWDFHQEKMVAFSIADPIVEDTDTWTTTHSWITVQGYNAIVFRVRAKYNVELILSATQGDVTTDTTMITIEEEYGESAMYHIKGTEHTELASLRTVNILDGEHFRAFWVRWNLNEIQIGTGAEIGKNSFLRHVDQNIHYTSAIALANKAGFKAEWEILSLYGNTYNVYTPGDNLLMYGESRPVLYDDYVGEVKVKAGEFSFTVQSHGHAIITLLPDVELVENGTPCYQVVLGGNANTKVYIEKLLTCDPLEAYGSELLAETLLPSSVLDGRVDRQFWVHWNYAGLVRMGSGFKVGSFELLRYEDPKHVQLTRVHFSSANEEPAAWVTSQKPGEVVTYTTPKGYQYNTTFISVLDKNFILFKVATCQGAHIAVSHVPQNVWVNTYEVVLGAEDNRKVEIRKGIRGPVVEDECLSDCINTVDCVKLRSFWIQWGDRKLSVGTGIEPGLDSTRMITYKDFDLKSVTTIAFASFTGNMGWWEVAYTAPDLGFEHATTPKPTTTPVYVPTTAPDEPTDVPTVAPATPTDPPTTASTPPSTTKKYIPVHSATMTLNANYNTIRGNETAFEANIKSQLEEELGKEVLITKVSEGSIVVEFVTEAKLDDIKELQNSTFVGLDGHTLIEVDKIEADIAPPTPTPNDGKADKGGMSGGESFGVAVGVIALIILVVVLAFFGYRYWFVGPKGESIPVHFSNPGYTEADNFDAKVIFPMDSQPGSEEKGGI